MPHIIIKNRPARERFLDLQLDEDQVGHAKAKIQEIVEESFGDKFDAATETELARRVRICVDWFCDLYGDRGLGWSISRTLEHIPTALACELAGLQYVPEPAGEQGYRTHKPGRIPWTRI